MVNHNFHDSTELDIIYLHINVELISKKIDNFVLSYNDIIFNEILTYHNEFIRIST